jgi:hypothetical protein
MAKFHIVHIIPDPRLKILNGYNDVIKAVIWGLRALGHEVSYALNQHHPEARNIVFGATWAFAEMVAVWPDDTILYNLEQVHAVADLDRGAQSLPILAGRFKIWDYSARNVAQWKKFVPEVDIDLVPIGFSPAMCYPREPVYQDIDVLMFGTPSDRRMGIYRTLCDINLAAVFVCGLYDDPRDNMIARAKVVLNVTVEQASIFSIVRVAHLLANRKAVVTDLPPDVEIEPDIIPAMLVLPDDQLANVCWHLVHNDKVRHELEETGYGIIARRDICAILTQALVAC